MSKLLALIIAVSCAVLLFALGTVVSGNGGGSLFWLLALQSVLLVFSLGYLVVTVIRQEQLGLRHGEAVADLSGSEMKRHVNWMRTRSQFPAA